MEKEEHTFSIPSTSNYSIPNSPYSSKLNTSIFSSISPTKILQSSQNIQLHNPLTKRSSNHTLIKMLGKINGQPITQSTYKLKSFQVDQTVNKIQLDKIKQENKNLIIKVKRLQQTISKLSNDPHQFLSLKSKLSQKQQQYSHLKQSYQTQKQKSFSLLSQISYHKQLIKKVQYQIIILKQQKNRSVSNISDLKKQKQQINTKYQIQSEELFKIKIATSHYKTLEKQMELVNNQLVFQKQNIMKLEKDNQYLRGRIVELSKIGGGGDGLFYRQNPELELRISQLEKKRKVDEKMLKESNEEIMRIMLKEFNDKYKQLL